MLNIWYSLSLVIMLTINVYIDLYCSQDGDTALHLACLGGHNQVVGLLLQAGACVDQETEVRWEISQVVLLNSTHIP